MEDRAKRRMRTEREHTSTAGTGVVLLYTTGASLAIVGVCENRARSRESPLILHRMLKSAAICRPET